MKIFKIRELYESLGAKEFCKVAVPMVERKEIMEDASNKEWAMLYEAVDSTTFVNLIGSRIALTVRDGYNFVQNPLEGVLKRIPSSLKTETVVGMKGPAGLDIVKEGMDYPAKGISELKLDFDNEKYGELVEITWETIKFDRYNAVIKAAQEVGENAKLKLAELYADALYDAGNTGYDGSGVYTTAHGNAASNVLNTANLETAITTMREFTDDESRPIVVIPKWLVVCEDLRIPALKLIKSIQEPGTIENDYNVLKDEGLKVISCPFWTATDTVWVLVGTKAGAQRGWQYQEVLPIEIYTRRGQSTEEGFRRDIEAMWKVRLMGAARCDDFHYAYRGGVAAG